MSDISRKGIDDNVCYYCGKRADTIDHVIPQSILRQLSTLNDVEITKAILKNRALKVYSCLECNTLASSSLQDTLAERKKFVKDKIRKRYKRILNIPHWEQEEIDAMGRIMSQYVTEGIKAKELIKRRLAW